MFNWAILERPDMSENSERKTDSLLIIIINIDMMNQSLTPCRIHSDAPLALVTLMATR